MQHDHLKVFLYVSDLNSINKASEKLYMSRQNVSKIIANLESEFQIQLFVRNKNGVKLTEDGQTFYNYAIEILKLTDTMLAHAHTKSTVSSDIHGHIEICFTVPMDNQIMNLISNFIKLNPHISIHITEKINSFFEDIVGNLSTLPYDIIFSHSPTDTNRLSDKKLYNIYPLKSFDFSLFLLARTDDPICAQKTIPLTEVSELPIVLYNTTETFSLNKVNIMLNDYKKKAITPIVSSNNYNHCLQYVLDKTGYLLITDASVTNSLYNNSQISLIPINPSIVVEMILATPAKVLQTQETFSFVEFILNSFTSTSS